MLHKFYGLRMNRYILQQLLIYSLFQLIVLFLNFLYCNKIFACVNRRKTRTANFLDIRTLIFEESLNIWKLLRMTVHGQLLVHLVLSKWFWAKLFYFFLVSCGRAARGWVGFDINIVTTLSFIQHFLMNLNSSILDSRHYKNSVY